MVKAARDLGRLPAALALSAALHAGLLAWLAAREPASGPEAERIEVQLVEVERPTEPPRGLSAAGGGPPVAKPKRTAQRSAAIRASPITTPTQAPAAVSVSHPPVGTGVTQVPGSTEWLAIHGLEPAEGRGASLALPWRGGGSVREGAPSAAEPVPGEPSEVAAKRNVDGWLRDVIAMGKAAQQPDAYWSELRQRLAKGFSPGWEILTGTRHEVAPLSSGQMRVLAEFWKGYEEQAARYGATGNAHLPEEGAPGMRRGVVDGVRGLSVLPDNEGVLAAARPESRIFHRQLVALIRIRQDPDGKVAAVWLVRSSGIAAYDRLAMEQVATLCAEEAAPLGPTPPQGRETLWAFATQLDMTPPVPVVGLSFDAHFAPTGVAYPLKKSARSQVELKAVY